MAVNTASRVDVAARLACTETDTHSRTARIARSSQMTQREGQTAIYAAAAQGWMRVVEFMLERGAEVDVTDTHSRSPLDVALARLDRGSEQASRIAALLGPAAAAKAAQKHFQLAG